MTGSRRAKNVGISIGRVINPYHGILPVMAVAKITSTVRDLILGKVLGIHDSILAFVPDTAGIGLTTTIIIAASGSTTGVLKTFADLTIDIDSGVNLTARSDMDEWLIAKHRIAHNTPTNALF